MASLDYLEIASTRESLRDVRPRLEAIFRRYRVPPRSAGILLEEVAFELVYKGERIEDPGQWVVRAVRRKCRELWVAQRRRVWRRLETLPAKR